MSWEWSRSNEEDLAKFVNDDVQRWLSLPAQLPNDRYGLIKTIYNTLKEKEIRYAPDEYHPSAAIQRIRQPAEIFGPPNEGTCLDLALLFCGLCFGYELLPWVIVIKGHALVAVSLTHSRADWNAISRKEVNYFKNDPLKTVEPLCELIDGGAYIAIECTGFAYIESLSDSVPEGMRREKGFLSFDKAVETGRKQLEQKERPFQFALDIAIAHYGWRLEPHEIELPTFTPTEPNDSSSTPSINRGITAISDIVRNMGRQPPAAQILQFAIIVLIILFVITILLIIKNASMEQYTMACGSICFFAFITFIFHVGYLLITQHLSIRDQREMRNLHDELYHSLRS
jgi:hypothetical protein